MIKAVLFDMDGLMFDTESAYSVVQEKMSAKRGKVFTTDIKTTLMGKRAHEVMEQLNQFWSNNENNSDLLKEQDIELIYLYKSVVEKLSGLDSLIDFLNKNRIRKCIGTSSRRFLVDILLKKHDLEQEFECIVSGDEVKRGKPDPEIYATCVRQLALPPQSCLVLEDSLNGVTSGNSAGCHTCAIPSVYTKHEDFSSATLLANSLSDQRLLNFLK